MRAGDTLGEIHDFQSFKREPLIIHHKYLVGTPNVLVSPAAPHARSRQRVGIPANPEGHYRGGLAAIPSKRWASARATAFEEKVRMEARLVIALSMSISTSSQKLPMLGKSEQSVRRCICNTNVITNPTVG